MWFGKRSNSGAVEAFCGQRPTRYAALHPNPAQTKTPCIHEEAGRPKHQRWPLKSIILGIAPAHPAATAESDFERAELLQAGQFGGTKVGIV